MSKTNGPGKRTGQPAGQQPKRASGHVARLRGGAEVPEVRAGGPGAPSGAKQATGDPPRTLKELAAALSKFGHDAWTGKIDLETARVVLRGLQTEFRCLELDLRYGVKDIVVSKQQ